MSEASPRPETDSSDPEPIILLDVTDLANISVNPSNNKNQVTLLAVDGLLIGDQPAVLQIDRQTGAAVIHANQDVTFFGYEVQSASSNGLNDAAWTSIASTGADPNDTWTELSSPGDTKSLAEADVAATGANDGFTLLAGNDYSLGDIWQTLPTQFEDLQFDLRDLNGDTIANSVIYDGTTIPLGDYSGNESVGPEDWPTFRAGLGSNYEGMTAAQAYLGGDLDGDFDSDIDDFRLFVAAAGGAGARFRRRPCLNRRRM